jgi:hypothetical protein
MKLLLLSERQAFGRERFGQSLLVDVLGKAGTQLAIDIMQTADDIVGSLDQLLPFGFLDGAEALRLLREERLDICGFHKFFICWLVVYCLIICLPKTSSFILFVVQTDGGLFFFDDQFGLELGTKITLGTLDSSCQSRSDIRRYHIRRSIVRELA